MSAKPKETRLSSPPKHGLENPSSVASEVPTGRQHASPGQRPGLHRTQESGALNGRDKGGQP